jgi:hypothetical protein
VRVCPGLHRMIDLKDPKRMGPRWLPIREGIESCSEQYVLAHTVANRFRKTVFGIATARRRTRENFAALLVQ